MNTDYGKLFASMKASSRIAFCSRCSRPLTDPDSIRLGMGPECIAKSGLVDGGEDQDGDGEAGPKES